ncbi:MAG: hypothetical protein A2Y81_11760 [Nitrospirae bacterium RBG_13_43_8]|nr:MAG: hypothetical protein A2Y81_11760 [Nitrospirae bacterium RBG_13_43_8]
MNVPEIVGVLALVIIVVIVLSIILIRGQAWGIDTIPGMIDQWFGTSSPEEKTLIKGMACAYYRCIEGCASGLVKTAIWEDDDGNKISCLESYCKDEWRDSDGKICDDNSRAHPVEISVSESITLIPGGFFNAINPVEECTKSAGGMGYAGTQWVFVDENLKAGYCGKERCEMIATTYYIWMDDGWLGSKVTIICSTP